MITGDNINTARTIALEAGILDADGNSKYSVMEGSEFRYIKYN